MKGHGLKPVQAVSFDLDETLLDGSRFRDAIPRTCDQLAKASGLDAGRLVEANSEIWQSYWPEVEREWALGGVSSAEVSREAWRRTLLACGRDDDSLARLAVRILSEQRLKVIGLHDDVREMFKLLKPRYRLGLVTNGASDTQRGAIRALDIEKMFDAIVISGEVGVAKPEMSIFNLALAKLGVGKETVWHVGDSLRTDVAGALGAGMTAVWLNRAGSPRKEGDPRPDYEIRSLRELAPLLSACRPVA